MILYCKDCDSLYLMKSHYEASSKIDFENDVKAFLHKNYRCVKVFWWTNSVFGYIMWTKRGDILWILHQRSKMQE